MTDQIGSGSDPSLPDGREWSVEDTPAAHHVAVVAGGVMAFGRAEAAGGNPIPIASFLRESDSIVAGATGRTEFERLFIDFLWVREDLRGSGLGRAALARIEDAARRRGARDALIETLNDRAAALYRRCGYVEVASVARYVGRFTKHILVKQLD